jgi:hypothetical protein
VHTRQQLPRSVQEIADVIGRDLALKLVESLPRAYSPCHPSGQVILYVPKYLRPDHHLVALLGWEAARRLAHTFGGEMLMPAICYGLRSGERNSAILSMRASGATQQDIAREFRVSARHVRNILKEMAQVDCTQKTLNNAAA